MTDNTKTLLKGLAVVVGIIAALAFIIWLNLSAAEQFHNHLHDKAGR